MTPSRLASLSKLAEAATGGPWSEDDGNIFSDPLSAKREDAIVAIIGGDKSTPHPDDGLDQPLGWIASTEQAQPNFDNDAQFIAASRQAVPELCREVERLRKMLATVLEELEAYAGGPQDQDEEEAALIHAARELIGEGAR